MASRPGAGIASRAAALLLGTLLALLLAEGVARLVRPQAAGISHQPLIYVPDAQLGYRYRPGARDRIERLFEVDNEVVIDSHGFHDVERPTPAPGDPRPVVVAVGDSFTAALHVPVSQGWTQVLEARLAESRDPAPLVFNRGLDGTGSDVHLALVRESLAELHPSVVLVAFYANDVADVALGPRHREVHGRYLLMPDDEAQARRMRELADRLDRRRLARALFDASYLVRMGTFLARGDRNLMRNNVIHPAEVGGPPPRRAPDARSLRDIFDELARRVREHGARLFVVPVPARDTPAASLVAFRRAAGDLGIEVLDVLPLLRSRLEAEGGRFRDLYYHYDGHLNATGCRRFGEAVAELLAPRLGPPGPAGSGTHRAR